MLLFETGDENCLSKRPINLHQNKIQIIDKSKEVISMLYISNKAPFIGVASRKITLFRAKKISLVLIYAWLFMNSDPGYNQRVVTAMMMSRALTRHSPFSPFGGRRSNMNPGNSLSTIETIALIQAINSNNRGYQPLDLNRNSSPLRQLDMSRQQLEHSLERQLGPPVPRAAVVAAVAAFLTAVASGLNPVAAVAAAASAAAAALLIVLISLTRMKNKQDGKGKGKGKPLIKKLVIKKTVLPFVIPIVIKSKKEEEKIYKVYKKKPEHHHESKIKYKYKKTDEPMDKLDPDPSLKQIENLLEEQNKLQSVVDKIIKITEKDNSSVKSNKSSRTTLDRRMGTKRNPTKRKNSIRTSGRS